ncbi:hypothetical protein EBQ34_13405 [Vandammella animalimorsus]|uniref:Uncharacterized protein n=1 Tax=Vandammella animalimorsus TaxID=2029117 RepID=A0A3M6R352_9BURK|nr:hypothetical protein [Vandammella animalimorsus]RMX09452.1 hypothetical protein EBQ34_13405 [Vandammella animalimorsus]
MNPTPAIAPCFLALAQPVLRGLNGQALTVTPGQGGAPIAVQPWPGATASGGAGQAMRCWGHSAPHDPLPWLATHDRILALIDGHRPLAIQPRQLWGHDGAPPDAPYPAVVAAQAGGLTVFLVNAGSRVRVFAADQAQAVELPPIDDAQVYAAWAHQGQLWAAGMQPRPRDADGDVTGFGQALLLRWRMRPLAVQARWQGRDAWPVDETSTPAAERAGLTGMEAWLAALPGPSPAQPPWLIGAPLLRGVHDLPPDLSPFWMLGPPAPDDYNAAVLAQAQNAPGPSPAAPPLQLARVLAGHSLLAVCGQGAGHALVFMLAQPEAGAAARVHRLCLSRWDGARAQLSPAQPVDITGLPAEAGNATLLDWDAVHHPGFGFAATLLWRPARPGSGDGSDGSDGSGPVPAPAGAVLHSPDGQYWSVVQMLG